MTTIELSPGIFSSRIGFGCAPILGSVDANKAKRALDCALDCGINHFDLARSYGYGDAEQFVGNLLQGKRNNMVIASKFGIKANWKAGLLKPMKPLIRLIKQNMPKREANDMPVGNVAGVADRLIERVNLNPVEMRRSLERSLKALNTNYIDHFFVHEPSEFIANVDDLFETADRLKSEGKIRSFGIAYMVDKLPVHEKYINKFDLQQFNKPLTTAEYEKMAFERALKPNILFSVMKNRQKGQSPQAMLKQLMEDFPRSVVLLSMFNEEHIRQNAELLA